MVTKSKNIGNLRAEGRLDAIWWTGPAESTGRAEALELVKDVKVRSARFVPGTGAADSIGPCLAADTAVPRIRHILRWGVSGLCAECCMAHLVS